MVGNPDKLSEKWEYSEDLNTASNEKHQYSLGFLDAETNWSLTKTLRRKRRSLGQVYINSPNHKRYLKFSSTGTIERSCVCINQENDEHANQEPGKDNGNQNHCSKDGGESGHKYPEGIWSVESHYYTTKKLGRSNRLTPQYIVDRIDVFVFTRIRRQNYDNEAKKYRPTFRESIHNTTERLRVVQWWSRGRSKYHRLSHTVVSKNDIGACMTRLIAALYNLCDAKYVNKAKVAPIRKVDMAWPRPRAA